MQSTHTHTLVHTYIEATKRLTLGKGESVANIPGYKVPLLFLFCSMMIANLPKKLFIAGGMGGIAYWIAIYPVDVIKTTMQADSLNKATRKYSGFIDAARAIHTYVMMMTMMLMTWMRA